jgi:hypothetical protein
MQTCERISQIHQRLQHNKPTHSARVERDFQAGTAELRS